MLWRANNYTDKLFNAGLELVCFAGIAAISIFLVKYANSYLKAIALFGYFFAVIRLAKGSWAKTFGPLVLINLLGSHIQFLFVFNFYGQQLCRALIKKGQRSLELSRINRYMFNNKLSSILQLGVETGSLVHDLKTPLTTLGIGIEMLSNQDSLVVTELKNSHAQAIALVENIDQQTTQNALPQKFLLADVLPKSSSSVELIGNKQLLQRAFQNLITNAKAANSDQEPAITIDIQKQVAEIMISNNGKKLERWPWQSEKLESRSGWGLLISYLIITENWKGEMDIVPSNYATSIRIRLPIAKH